MAARAGEKNFRSQLRELEAVRAKLSDGQRREVNAARRNLKIHNWFHYAEIVGAIHRKTFGE